jgi:hypothetical protein
VNKVDWRLDGEHGASLPESSISGLSQHNLRECLEELNRQGDAGQQNNSPRSADVDLGALVCTLLNVI